MLSLLTSILWCLGQIIDVYRFAAVGAIFEIIWLPMMLLLVLLPIISFFHLAKEKFNPKSLYLYSFVIIIATGLITILLNQ